MCKIPKTHHWRDQLFFSPDLVDDGELDSDDEHGRDSGAEHGGEETAWNIDPVVENREKLGMVVTAA
ncbi:hypothetical protein YC2023_054691 [Brassica napus]